MRRFFTEPQNIDHDTAVIVEDAAHITRVLRMEPGDLLLLFDGSGMEYTAELIECTAQACRVNILSKTFSEQEPKTEIRLYQGIPKSGKMESIIQKSVELGAHSITPVSMDRCVAKLDRGKKEEEKIKRWNKISMEAAKQCGRGIIPTIHPSISFHQALQQMQEADLAIMPYEVLGHSGESSLKTTLQRASFQSIAVLIGPEGGFSDKEAESARQAGISMVGLGKRILRTETVSSAVTAMILYEKGEI